MNYELEKLTCEISADEYVKEYVDIPKFRELCNECPNLGANWGCPPFEFESSDLWKKFSSFRVYGYKVSFKDPCTIEEGSRALFNVKNQMSAELFEMEEDITGSYALSAGFCGTCHDRGEECTRKQNAPCRFGEKIRPSLESVGGDVTRTSEELLGVRILWGHDGMAPEYYSIIGGLLVP